MEKQCFTDFPFLGADSNSYSMVIDMEFKMTAVKMGDEATSGKGAKHFSQIHRSTYTDFCPYLAIDNRTFTFQCFSFRFSFRSFGI